MKKKVFLVKADSLVIPKEMRDYLDKNFIVHSKVDESEIIMVCGGDGAMLRAVRQYYQLRIAFCGLNYGHIGFLMNSPKLKILDEIAQEDFESIEINLLKAKTYNRDEKELGFEYAFNDFYFERASTQTAKIRIMVNDKVRFNPLICDGVIICSSAGSTAYNASAGGHVLPIGTNNLVLTGIVPAPFHNWHTIQLSSDAEVIFEAVETDQRPVRFIVDGIELSDVFKAKIKLSRKSVNILFAKSEDFREKRLRSQFSHY